MNKLYFGYTTGTHGLKGELKCFSDFERKDLVLKNNQPVYIKNKVHYITSVRPHKNCYLICFDNLNDINLVEEFRNQEIYVLRCDLNLLENEFLFSDLIGFSIYNNLEMVGKIKEVRYNKNSVLLSVIGDKNFLVPYNDFFIKKVDLKEQIIIGDNLEGLML